MRRENFFPTKNSKICSDHFLATDYYEFSRVLKPNSVPSIFAFPIHLQTISSCRNPPAKRGLSVTESTDTAQPVTKKVDNSPTKLELRNQIEDQKRKKRDFASLSVFSSLLIHDLDNDLSSEDIHSSQLSRITATKYFDLQLFRHGQHYIETVVRNGNIGVRQQSNKFVLFKSL